MYLIHYEITMNDTEMTQNEDTKHEYMITTFI